MNENLPRTDSVYNTKEIEKVNQDTDIYITGSDQVWNPVIVGELSDIFTLNFNSNNIKKISYAASVGNANMIKESAQLFKEKIEKLDAVSVREHDAQVVLDQLIDKPVKEVLDPTLLIDQEEWNESIKGMKTEKEKYIFTYGLPSDKEYLKIVNDLSKKTGLKIIHCGLRKNEYDNVAKTIYNEGPLEFINYIKNAEYVVSTSFHATAFSVIFNKKFFIVPHRKTGARVTSLLEKLNIKNRVYYSYDEFKDIDYDFETDWNEVNNNLKREKADSINWLKNAIN